MSAGDVRAQLPRSMRPAHDDGGLPYLQNVAGSQDGPPLTVEALCDEFAEVCESAVDPLEVASALEFDGISDQMVRDRYGYANVFALAGEMYIQVPRQPAEPPAPADPWQVSRIQPVLHGLLYGLPAVCFPAAAALLNGPGLHTILIVALLSAWGTSQGLASLGFLRLGRTTDRGQAKRLLRAGLVAGLVLITLIMGGSALLVHARLPAVLFGTAEGAYMLAACVLLVLGAERWLLAALAPGVLGSAVFLALGRPPGLEHAAWGSLALTPVLAIAAALICTRGSRAAGGRLMVAAELRDALPAVAFGVLAASLLAFPVIAGANGHGGLDVGALLATLPLSLSMGAAEWSLLAYRRRTRSLLRSTSDLRSFSRGSRLVLLRSVSQYLLAAVVLTAIAAAIAISVRIVVPSVLLAAELGVYLILGVGMFLALTLQALGARVVPILACAGALAFEIAWRDLGVTAQLAACTGLVVVLGGYATSVLARAVRHAF
jgi:hypothetical protein